MIANRIFLFLALFSTQYLFAQNAVSQIKVGDPAPPLDLEAMTQAPASWSKGLADQALVLEFWATWCPACVTVLPEINRLSDMFKGKPVKFIFITDEKDKQWVQAFLKYHPVSGWVGFDPDHRTFDAYQVTERPKTVLVTKNGKVAGIAGWGSLNEEVLNRLIEGKSPVFPTQQVIANPRPEATPSGAPLVEITLQRLGGKLEDSSRTGFGSPQWSFEDLVATAYEIPADRIVWEKKAPKVQYKFGVWVATNEEDQAIQYAQEILSKTLGLKVRWETREMDVIILTPPKNELGPLLRPANGQKREDIGLGMVSVRGHTLSDFAGYLEAAIGRMVIDESGLQGLYDAEVTWDPQKPESALERIQNQLGVGVRLEKRATRVLVVVDFHT